MIQLFHSMNCRNRREEILANCPHWNEGIQNLLTSIPTEDHEGVRFRSSLSAEVGR